jgi:hypothetical protein
VFKQEYEYEEDRVHHIVSHPDGRSGIGFTDDEAMDDADIPNWPKDRGAAFELIISALASLSTSEQPWEFKMNEDQVVIEPVDLSGCIWTYGGHSESGNTAHSLSALVLKAFEDLNK